MSSTSIILLSTVVCLTTAQWMPYLDPQNMGPFSHPMPDQMIVPKDSSTKIPIILLLKPKRAKSLSADTSSEAMERHQTDADQPFTLSEWMGMPQMSSDSMASPTTHVNQHMSASEYGLSVEPSPEASEEDEVSLKSRGGEQIKWPVLQGKNGVTAEQLASISQLFPKLAAMSASNPELADMANKNDGALFEDTLKKFTSNLTDLEHRKGEDNDKNNDEEEDPENSSESTIDTQSTGIAEALKSLQMQGNDNNSGSAEQRDTQQRLTLQKSRPFVNERKRIKIPVKSESNDQNFEPQTQTVVGQPSHKGWVPIKGRHKPKRKPSPSRPGSHKIVETHLHFPSEASPVDGQYLYHNSDRHVFGIPETLNSITSPEPAPHMFRPHRHFPHSYIPYDTKHSISHLPPYHKYSSYLTDGELTPTLMQMTADANKPQHMEPGKVEEVPSPLGAEKHKDIIDQKEGMIDNKHIIDEKHMIVDEKNGLHGLGEEILGQHLTCCDLLHGQHPHHSPHHVIHEEVIHKPDFDDDKVIANLGGQGFKNEFPGHFGGGSKYGSYPFAQSFHQKKPCHDSTPRSYPPTFWPPQVYRRPVYRPKLFYKPLLFG